MARYAGNLTTNDERLQDRIGQVQQVLSVAETPNEDRNPHPKRPRSESPLLFGQPDYSSVPVSSGLYISQETKKLVVSTCRSIVKLEASVKNLESKSDVLNQHRLDGTIPKDLLLPKKKALFEDEQSNVDDILQTAMNALLRHRITEISRKISESKTRIISLEREFLSVLQNSRDAQLRLLSEEDTDKISIVQQRYSLNVKNFYSQLAISRENFFLRSKREADKKEAKRRQEAMTPMDTAPEARVVDVLDQRLRQLGLIGRKPRPSSPSSSSMRSSSRSRTRSVSGSSTASIFSHASSHGSRSRSRSAKKRKGKNIKNKNRKPVTFDSSTREIHHTVTSRKTTRKRKRQRKPLTPQDRGVVGYLRYLNKCLLFSVPLFCLRFLSPKIHNYSNYVLSASERYLLSLGLNFRPTPRLLNVNVLNKQFEEFVRSARIRYFFRDFNTITSVHQFCKLRDKSEWTPPLGPPWIELPLSVIKPELCSLYNHPHHFSSNLSRSDYLNFVPTKVFAS